MVFNESNGYVKVEGLSRDLFRRPRYFSLSRLFSESLSDRLISDARIRNESSRAGIDFLFWANEENQGSSPNNVSKIAFLENINPVLITTSNVKHYF